MNGVGGCGVGGGDGGHHGQIYQSDPRNAPNECVSASKRKVFLSLCP